MKWLMKMLHTHGESPRRVFNGAAAADRHLWELRADHDRAIKRAVTAMSESTAIAEKIIQEAGRDK